MACPLTGLFLCLFFLIFAKPNLNSFDFFDLIWAVGITDFVLKYVTIGVKCFILFLPKILLAFKSRVIMCTWVLIWPEAEEHVWKRRH
ncbi:RING finger and transmembrane domain-containing protein 2-like [Cynoglossus semilaevis]|uniref:RING finger and transmembrane domain-containing protein 2-like n=1 Tax=Cynoglossus semilaevis TaxID=244447 RepID=UPI000D625D75|nr:RING finger and transmembrane domain-containing protein 2-like [Cynoglossus semilaevis]